MSLKALAIQYLERNGLRNDSGTIAEKAVPLASEKTQGGWNGISGVEQVETPVRSEPSPGPVSESLRDLPAVPSPTVPATSPTVENLDTRQAVRLVLTHCQRAGDQGVFDYVDTHPQRWGQWADEVNGMREMLHETEPGTDSGAVDSLAAEAVYWFIRLKMKLISQAEYSHRLHGPGGVWDRLRKGAMA